MKKRRRVRIDPTQPDPRSKSELNLYAYWSQNYTDTIVPQHIFHPIRQWRLDFAFPDLLIGIEIQGHGTGHTSYEGMQRDYKKHNEAMRLGWGIIYLMSSNLGPHQIGKTCEYILHILNTRRNNPTLITALRGLGHARSTTTENVRKSNDRGVNPLDEARRRLREGFDS